MNELKDKIRLSLGIIQEENGNIPLLSKMTSMALEAFRNNIQSNEGELWTRNSFEFDAHIPLLSDLDMTLVASSTETAKRLVKSKKKFLLIGEINFYHPQIFQDLIALANPFELLRDPVLIKKFNLSPETSECARTSFIVRQLLSDQKWLTSFPLVRKKKWQYLYHILGLKLEGLPTNQKILSLLRPEDRNNISKLLDLVILKEEDVFQLSKGSSWRYLAPQMHIWGEDLVEENAYISSLTNSQVNIFKEQIKWEFWGIGCHFYWLPKDVSIDHLSRLLKVYEKLNPAPKDLDSMKKILEFIRR